MYRAVDNSKILEPPLHVLFGYLKEGSRIRVHLNKNNKMCIEGTLLGFDEFMNLVLDDAYEIYLASDTKIPLGKTMLRGEVIAIVHPIIQYT